MSSISQNIKTAASIADEAITHTIHGDLLTIQWQSADIKRIRHHIEQALALDSDNPAIQYIDACLAIAQGQQKTGQETIEAIAQKYPEYIEAQGYNAYPEKWFSPFYYPVWREQQKQLPSHFASLPQDGTLLVSMRDGMQRIVSFFRHCEPGYCTLSKKTVVDFDLKVLETPYGLLAGVYLIIDPGKRTGRFSETMLSCNTLPLTITDMSTAGYWLLRLLATQSYTFIILHDTQTDTVYRKKHYFNAKQKKLLESTAIMLAAISPTTNWDRENFIKAQQYYMRHINIDTFFK